MRFPRSSTLAALCLLCCVCPTLRADPGVAIIARVGDTEVTADDIRAEIRALDAKTQAAAASDPTALSQVVRAILTQRLVLKQALAAKWDQDPAVTAALAHVRDNAIAETYLQSVSKPPDSFPSDAELKAAYDANKGQMLVPRQYDLAQIFVKDPTGAGDAAEAKAQVKLQSIHKALSKSGADFSAIARAESDEPQTAAKGGELGWLAENRIQPEIRAQLGSLSKGNLTAPLHLEDGWHILKVLDVKEPYTPSLEEVRPQLIQQMRAERARTSSQQYIAKLVQESPIQINELELSKVLKSP